MKKTFTRRLVLGAAALGVAAIGAPALAQA
jgi:hypothetical protein